MSYILYTCVDLGFYSHQGTISVGVDATDLFDRYEEDYEDVVGGGVPHVEINKMHISQSIEVMGSTKFYIFLKSRLLGRALSQMA